jgi:hypothetical protein
MPSTDIKDYYRRSWGLGDRQPQRRLKAALPLLAPALLPYAAAFIGTTATGLMAQQKIQNYFENNPDALDKFKEFVSFKKKKEEPSKEVVEVEQEDWSGSFKDKKEDPLKEPPDPYKDFETLSKVLDQYRKFDEKRKEKNKKKPPTRIIDGEGNVTFSTRGPRLDPVPEEAYQIDKADQQNAVIFANRLLSKIGVAGRKKKRSPGDRKELVLFRKRPNLKKFKNKFESLYDFRKNPKLLEKQIKGLKEEGVNFDEFYNPAEIAALLGLPTASGVTDALRTGNVPFKKIGPFKGVKLNDYVNHITKQTERLSNVPPVDVRTLARTTFLSELGGNFYQRFKDMRRPKWMPPKVKEIYEKYNLSEIEGGHAFPIEFFTQKYAKDGKLSDERQFDWIYRNKDKLIDKNNIVFQSKELNAQGGPFYEAIGLLKEQYKTLAPLVDKYEGKGPVTNLKDKKIIEEANNKIMNIIAKTQFDAQEYIEKSTSPISLPNMKEGGIHGALFNTDTGTVSLYTGAGESAGTSTSAVEKGGTYEKLNLASKYLDIVSSIIEDEGDKQILIEYINNKILPRYSKGGLSGVDYYIMNRYR